MANNHEAARYARQVASMLIVVSSSLERDGEIRRDRMQDVVDSLFEFATALQVKPTIFACAEPLVRALETVIPEFYLPSYIKDHTELADKLVLAMAGSAVLVEKQRYDLDAQKVGEYDLIIEEREKERLKVLIREHDEKVTDCITQKH